MRSLARDCKNINRVSDLITTLVEKRISASDSVTLKPATMSSTPPSNPNKKRSLVKCLENVRRLREYEQQIMDGIGVSPNTKHLILNKIQEEKKKVITKAANDDV